MLTSENIEELSRKYPWFSAYIIQIANESYSADTVEALDYILSREYVMVWSLTNAAPQSVRMYVSSCADISELYGLIDDSYRMRTPVSHTINAIFHNGVECDYTYQPVVVTVTPRETQ